MPMVTAPHSSAEMQALLRVLFMMFPLNGQRTRGARDSPLRVRKRHRLLLVPGKSRSELWGFGGDPGKVGRSAITRQVDPSRTNFRPAGFGNQNAAEVPL